MRYFVMRKGRLPSRQAVSCHFGSCPRCWRCWLWRPCASGICSRLPYPAPWADMKWCSRYPHRIELSRLEQHCIEQNAPVDARRPERFGFRKHHQRTAAMRTASYRNHKIRHTQCIVCILVYFHRTGEGQLRSKAKSEIFHAPWPYEAYNSHILAVTFDAPWSFYLYEFPYEPLTRFSVPLAG